ncbi:MAG TPA: Na+/H+ antiporter NhaA [Thermoanaerobaculia bacterium]|nr:Na+/H+ antiporter NhaA [Thermoanaerobaculia bacterium]
MARTNQNLPKPIRFLLENSAFLILGAMAGLAWANLDHPGYEKLLHFAILENSWIGVPHGATKVIDFHFLINEILMALFFAIAGIEVRKAFLPGGPLARPREAATTLIATLGGIAIPALVFVAGAALLGDLDALGRGWAIPCATDIAFSYMVARFVFGAGHPAIPFLLLLAIVDDAAGLIILAVFYPQKAVEPAWLLLAVAAMGLAWLFHRLRVHSFWPYLLIAGAISWFGFAQAGLHPALGLLPIIPVMPHAHSDKGLYDWSRLGRQDTITALEVWWKNPVELILGLFGLLNAGVVFESMGEVTWLVLAGLLIGKPLGIWSFGLFSARKLGFGLPGGMSGRDLFVIGWAAAIGFTVALFVSTVAFPPGGLQDAAKMGALLSFLAAPITILVARLLGIEKRPADAA